MFPSMRGATRDHTFPSLGQAIGLLAVFLLLQLALYGALVVARPVLPLPPDHPGMTGLMILLAGGVVIWYGWSRRGGAPDETYPLAPAPAALFAGAACTVVGLGIVVSEADNALRSVLPPPDWVTEAFEPLYDPQNMWGALLTLVIAAPLTEEPIFRGLILRGFLARYPTRKAVLVSALLFGAVHLNPWQFVGGTAFGVLAGWGLVRTGSVVPGFVGHALNNGLPSLAQAFGLEIRGYTGALSGPVQFQPLWFDAVGAVLLGTGLWLTRRALPDTFPPPRINPTNSTAPSS